MCVYEIDVYLFLAVWLIHKKIHTHTHTHTHTPTGIQWFGADKIVLFSDAEDNSIEITSRFHFGYYWTRQSIITEVGQVVFQENSYGW
jgi:hypothetical protein